MRPFQAVLATIGIVVLIAAFALLVSPGLAREPLCFPEATGYCIQGRIREFWEQQGGLPVFGYPIGPQRGEVIEGIRYEVQWFERTRLELHPENDPPYDVLMGRLGANRLALQGESRQAFAVEQPDGNCRSFAETGHQVCGEFLQAWRADGLEMDGQPGKSEAENLALFGVPLSGPRTETLSNGKHHVVQWFERARFELHPDNPPTYRVLYGLLGHEVYTTLPTASTNTPTLTYSTRTPTLTPTYTRTPTATGGYQMTTTAARQTYEAIKPPTPDDDDNDDDDPSGPTVWPTPPTETPTSSPTIVMTPTDTMPPIVTFAAMPDATATMTATATSTPTSPPHPGPAGTATLLPTLPVLSSPTLHPVATLSPVPTLSPALTTTPTPDGDMVTATIPGSPSVPSVVLQTPTPPSTLTHTPAASPSPRPTLTHTPAASPTPPPSTLTPTTASPLPPRPLP